MTTRVKVSADHVDSRVAVRVRSVSRNHSQVYSEQVIRTDEPDVTFEVHSGAVLIVDEVPIESVPVKTKEQTAEDAKRARKNLGV